MDIDTTWLHGKLLEAGIGIITIFSGWNLWLTRKNITLDKKLAAHEAAAKERDDATMQMIQMSYEAASGTNEEIKSLREESRQERRAMRESIEGQIQTIMTHLLEKGK